MKLKPKPFFSKKVKSQKIKKKKRQINNQFYQQGLCAYHGGTINEVILLGAGATKFLFSLFVISSVTRLLPEE